MPVYSDTDDFLHAWCRMEDLATQHLNKEECLSEFVEELFHAGYLTSREYSRFQTLRSFRNDLVHHYSRDLQAKIAGILPELFDLTDAVVRGYDSMREASPIRRARPMAIADPDPYSPPEKTVSVRKPLNDPDAAIPKGSSGPVRVRRPGDDYLMTDSELAATMRMFEKGKKTEKGEK